MVVVGGGGGGGVVVVVVVVVVVAVVVVVVVVVVVILQEADCTCTALEKLVPLLIINTAPLQQHIPKFHGHILCNNITQLRL